MRVGFTLATILLCGVTVVAPERAAAWDVVLNNAAREAPECVSWGAGRLDCFIRQSNGHLAWVAYAQGKWSPAQDLGGDLPVGVDCVVRGPGGINCFAPSAKGVLAEIHLNGAKWSAWSSLGGELAIGRASCVSLSTDHIACFARSKRGQLVSRRWDGGASWSEWSNLGGALTADPACVVLGGARVACFGRGPDAQLVAYLPNDAVGTAGMWVTYGGHVEGRPACSALNATDIACAARGEGDKLFVVRGSAIAGRATGKLVATGDPATADPTCVAESSDFTCFVRNSSRRLLRRTIAANGDMSDGRTLDSAPELTGAICLSMQTTALVCLIGDTERRIQFAMGGELNGEQITGAEATGVDESPQGNWYLSSLETNLTCRVRLFADKDDGSKRLDFDPGCEELPVVSRASQWDEEEDLLEFMTPRGRVVARFRLTGSGRWISPSPRSPYMLSRDRPEGAASETSDETPPTGLRFDEGDTRGLVGQWRLSDGAGDRSCGVRLTDWPAGGGNAVVLNGPCPSDFRAVQSWSMDRNAVVLATGDGRIVARFTRQSPGAWQGENAQGTASYALTR